MGITNAAMLLSYFVDVWSVVHTNILYSLGQAHYIEYTNTLTHRRIQTWSTHIHILTANKLLIKQKKNELVKTTIAKA